MFDKILRGRYGFDILSLVLVLIALVLSNIRYVWIIGLLLVVIALFRTLSKNINKRLKEQQRFEKFYKPIVSWFVLNIK